MILSHIVAVSKNNAIGKKNDLPWKIPEDLKFFKDKTLNSIMIMGRKTYDSIGRPLPKRTTIVVSKSTSAENYPDEVYLASSIDEAIEKSKELASKMSKAEIFIVGGGEIYKQSLSQIDKAYVTRIDTVVEGDAYYPELEEGQFKIVSMVPSKDDNYTYAFYEYQKV